jgi:hypothetical protein
MTERKAVGLFNILLIWIHELDYPSRYSDSYGLDCWGSIPGRGRNFSLLHILQTATRAHPAFSPIGTMGHFPRDEVSNG